MTYRSRYTGLSSCLALIPIVLTACSSSAPTPATPADATAAIATVFESTEPYSTRTLSRAALDAFFEKNPEYKNDSANIGRFYQGRNMQFAWILGDSISANAEAFATLSGVAEREVPNATPGTRRLTRLYDDGFAGAQRVALCDSCATEVELRLTAEFFRFAARNPGGSLDRDPRTLSWYIPRAKKDFSRLVDSLAIGKMDLAGYEPPHRQYKVLKGHLVGYAALAKEPWTRIEWLEKTRRIKPGDSSEVMVEIGRKLRLLGDLQGDSTSSRYDSTTAEAVRRFQTRHGMDADAVIDAALVRAINVSPAQRMRTMVINMERLRWVADQQPPNLLLVNIPEFRLHVFENDSEVMTMEVVVGARATRTVTFGDTLTQLVFSPSWSVPTSIVRNEILPAIKKDSRYLAKHEMQITGGTDDEPEIRQRPGRLNPLGGVKFVFPNSYNIYMHDTPAKGLFANEQLAASHGCIRLSRAYDLAKYLLRNDAGWTADRIRDAMVRGKEQAVKLGDSRPVAIVYFTAWVDRNGVLQFREDVYGHDKTLEGELFAKVTPMT